MATSPSSNYKLDCRFNKADLTRKIRRIADHKEQIELTNLDALDFVSTVLPQMDKRGLVNLDPPYFGKGPEEPSEGILESHHLVHAAGGSVRRVLVKDARARTERAFKLFDASQGQAHKLLTPNVHQEERHGQGDDEDADDDENHGVHALLDGREDSTISEHREHHEEVERLDPLVSVELPMVPEVLNLMHEHRLSQPSSKVSST